MGGVNQEGTRFGRRKASFEPGLDKHAFGSHKSRRMLPSIHVNKHIDCRMPFAVCSLTSNR